MKLKDWLKENKFTQNDLVDIFANNDLSITQGCVTKWVNDKRIPRKKEMLLLKNISKGKVMPNDFYI